MDSLPNFLTHGAPLRAREARARSSAIIRFERILKTGSEKSKKLGKGSVTIFHQNPEKTLLQARKTLKTAFFLRTSFSDDHGQKSWDTSAFLGRFPIHTRPTPPLTPQTMLDEGIQNFF